MGPASITAVHLAASDVVAQHELGRMRTQVDLSGQIGHVVASEVVREQRQRNDERLWAGRVRLDERQQLGAIAGLLFDCFVPGAGIEPARPLRDPGF